MKQTYLSILCLLVCHSIQSQTSIVLKSIRYHDQSGKTLHLWELPQTKLLFIKSLDSLSKAFWQIPSRMSASFELQETNTPTKPFIDEIYRANPKADPINSAFGVQTLQQNEKAPFLLDFEMVELPMSSLNKLIGIDSNFRKRFLSAPKIGLFHMVATIQSNQGETVFKKGASFLLYRNKRVNSFGFHHPDYGLSPKNFQTLLEKGLSVLLDKSVSIGLNELEFDPALMNDNFIQPYVQEQAKVFITSEKNNLQYLWKDQMQYLQYEEPAYEEIYLTKEEKASLPKNLKKEIRAVDLRYPFFALEESRDIFSNNNYTLKTTVYAMRNSADEPRRFTYNVRTGLPLVFVNGKTHVFLKDKDTLAHFSIRTDQKDSKKKKLLHQLVENKNGSISNIEASPRTRTQEYAFVLEGQYKCKPLKINGSGMRGMSTVIREIYLDNQLVAIVQGMTSPEIMVVLDKSLDAPTISQLLLLSFSRLF